MLALSVLLTSTHPFKVTYHTNFAKIKDILGEIEVDLLVLTYTHTLESKDCFHMRFHFLNPLG